MTTSNIPYFAFFYLLILQLHTLRNLTFLYGVVFACLSLTALFLVALNFHKHVFELKHRVLLFLLFLSLCYPLLSIIFGMFDNTYINNNGYLIGILRVIFVVPAYFLLLTLNATVNVKNNLTFVVVVISVIAALTIPYQFIFGEISWFAESSERAGLARYASLFGSLTSYGVYVGIAILLTSLLNCSIYLKTIFYILLLLSSFLSLQKAAIFNSFIAFFIIFATSKFNLNKALKICAFAFLPFILLGSFFGEEISTYLNLFFASNTEAERGDDVTFIESVGDRLSELPLLAINFHGQSRLLLGVGPIGGSGSFGYPEVPMAHNGIIDLLLIGGIPYLLIVIIFFTFLCKNLFFNSFGALSSRYSQNEKFSFKIIFFALLLYITNIPFSGLVFFSPPGAMFLILIITLSRDLPPIKYAIQQKHI